MPRLNVTGIFDMIAMPAVRSGPLMVSWIMPRALAIGIAAHGHKVGSCSAKKTQYLLVVIVLLTISAGRSFCREGTGPPAISPIFSRDEPPDPVTDPVTTDT
jgi:hypothetical protein